MNKDHPDRRRKYEKPRLEVVVVKLDEVMTVCGKASLACMGTECAPGNATS